MISNLESPLELVLLLFVHSPLSFTKLPAAIELDPINFVGPYRARLGSFAAISPSDTSRSRGRTSGNLDWDPEACAIVL
jgi:hypothetical protein